jgi:SARP family transcriptional regulator, regulator of embCAB operon
MRTKAKLDFRVLGPIEAFVDGHPLALLGRKQRGLLAILLLHANELVSTDRLIDELWGDAQPANADKSLQMQVSRLRRELDNACANSETPAILVTRPPGYVLKLEEDELDLHRFERLVEGGRTAFDAGDTEAAASRFRAALSLWRGTPLADVIFEPFAQRQIARLEELYVAALEDRIDADLALGRHAALVAELQGLVRDHPLRERLRAQLIVALYRSGRQADALHEYWHTRRILADELEIEPSDELQRVEKVILKHDRSREVPSGREATREQTADELRSERAKRPSRPALLGAAMLFAAGFAVRVVARTHNEARGGR